MKGIRKLFLGLVFMTLIGVGFKVDVKADPTATLDWNSTPELVLKISCSADDYPALGATGNEEIYTYMVPFKKGAHELTPTQGIRLRATRNGTDQTNEYQIVGQTTWNPATTAAVQLGTIDKDDVRTFINDYGTAGIDSKTVEVTVEQGGSASATADVTNAPGTTRGSKSLSTYKLTLDAAYKGGLFPTLPAGATGPGLTITPAGNNYLVPGETVTVDANFTAGYGGYKLKQWLENGVVKKTVTETNHNCSVTMGAAPMTMTADYDKNENGLTITGLSNSIVAMGYESVAKPYSFTGGYQKQYVDKVYLNDVEITGTFTGVATATSGDFSFTSGVAGNKIRVLMDDGIEYEFPVSVINPSSITFSVTSPLVLYEGKAAKTLQYSAGGATLSNINYTYSTGYATYITPTQSGMNLSVKGEKVNGSNPVTITVAPTFNVEGYTTPASLTKTVTVNVKSGSDLVFNEVFVNNKQSVTLSKFLKSGDAGYEAATITNNASSYIDVNPTSGALNKVGITGKSKTKATSNAIVVDGDAKASVTVYPEPAISVETTSGSSATGAYTYAYKVTMPKGVYYGDDTSVWVSDLKKAILIIKGSGDDPKKKEITLDSSWSDDSDKLSMSVTKKIDVKTLTGYLRDVGKKDEESFKVYACAVNGKGNNDDKIKTEEKEIKAYKIVLDTNGGKTSYTVNGDACYDYFYKIDGVEYTVVARGTGTLDKKNSVNADNATTSNGTATIVLGSSGAGVLGERKIKAAFTGSNTADPTTEGGGDGYDEVPKTGESKADIWILWTVLFISILGAGFMIWKRFGLVKAIAEAEQEQAYAEHEEQVKAEKKAKEDKLNMLKDLRNL